MKNRIAEFYHIPVTELKDKGVVFDYSVPFQLQQIVYSLTGHNMNGHIVMAYFKYGPVGGWPVAVSEIGAVMMGALDKDREKEGGEFEGYCRRIPEKWFTGKEVEK